MAFSLPSSSSSSSDLKFPKGASETTTATATKTSLENVTSRNFYYFAIIPIRSPCTMWAKYPGTNFMGTAFKWGKKMKNSPSCAHVLQKTLNLVISRCCFADDGKEMYKNIKRTCRAIVFAH